MPALATNAKIELPEQVKFEVATGLVTVTDSKHEHKALSEGDTYKSPKSGGITIHCIESARINFVDLNVKDPEVEKPSKVDSLPKKDVEKVKTPVEKPETSDEKQAAKSAKKDAKAGKNGK